MFGEQCPDSSVVECEMGVWGVGGDMGNMEKGWGREGRIPVLLANSTSVYVLSKACTDMSLKACTHERSLRQWNPPFTILDPPLVQRGCVARSSQSVTKRRTREGREDS